MSIEQDSCFVKFDPEQIENRIKEKGFSPYTALILKTFCENGSFNKMPNSHPKIDWHRNINITYQYFMNDMSMSEIGSQYSISEQAISKIIKQTSRRLWHASPLESRSTLRVWLISVERQSN